VPACVASAARAQWFWGLGGRSPALAVFQHLHVIMSSQGRVAPSCFASSCETRTVPNSFATHRTPSMHPFNRKGVRAGAAAAARDGKGSRSIDRFIIRATPPPGGGASSFAQQTAAAAFSLDQGATSKKCPTACGRCSWWQPPCSSSYQARPGASGPPGAPVPLPAAPPRHSPPRRRRLR
jgi:hypothetical protein